jgi:hypothetical protein
MGLRIAENNRTMRRYKANIPIVIFLLGSFVSLYAPRAEAGTCVISSNVTQTQAQLVSCAGGSLDGLTVSTGHTLTLSEPITVAGTVTIDGTVGVAPVFSTSKM